MAEPPPTTAATATDEPGTARPGEFAPLEIGPLEVWPPVVLAPMAGVTNAAFRRLCRRYGAGLYVSEMVNARGLVEGGTKSWDLAAFDADESPRSIQLYGTDPATMHAAVRRLVDEGHVDHIDLNFGCPVRKVTRHGGGSALTVKPKLLAAVVAATVDAAGPVPVTVKVRTGVDDELSTFLDVGRIAQDTGAAAIALHARTAAQLYSGRADWSAITALKAAVAIPVLGNGDVWQATDAIRMLRETGADGVVVGRGCLGRPWMFRDLVDVFDGRSPQPAPLLGEVTAILVDHARLLTDRRGEEGALRDLRKHTGWYLTGYPVGGEVRRALSTVATLADLEAIVADLDPHLAVIREALGAPRGTQSGPQQVTLPEGWLEHRDDLTPPNALADALVSGG